MQHNSGEREAAALDAQKIVEQEACGFRRKLLAERVVPTIVALRTRLDEICRQELEFFRQECGPFSKDESALLGEVAVASLGELQVRWPANSRNFRKRRNRSR